MIEGHIPDMKTLTLLLILITSLSLPAADPAGGREGGINGYETFYNLGKNEAAKKARQMAATDFAQGRYRILVYGLRRQDSPAEVNLKKRYGVATVPIAGCIVSSGITAAAESYNSTMKPLLRRKFGRDIFKEGGDRAD